jgi:hypothetical protein
MYSFKGFGKYTLLRKDENCYLETREKMKIVCVKMVRNGYEREFEKGENAVDGRLEKGERRNVAGREAEKRVCGKSALRVGRNARGDSGERRKKMCGKKRVGREGVGKVA